MYTRHVQDLFRDSFFQPVPPLQSLLHGDFDFSLAEPIESDFGLAWLICLLGDRGEWWKYDVPYFWMGLG
jgi:hypothetical protein